MARGHVKLGALGTTLREYVIMPERWRKSQANPWTTRISTGGDKYDDQEPFSFHVEQDWQAGVGSKAEDGGGFLFSTAETRVPGQIILPQLVTQSDDRLEDGTLADARNLSYRSMSALMEVSSTGAVRRVAIKMPGSKGVGDLFFSFYALVPDGTQVTIECRSTSTTGTLHESLTYTSTLEQPMLQWCGVEIAYGGTGSADRYLIIYPTSGTIYLACTAAYTNAVTSGYNGTTWSTLSGNVYPIFTSNFYPIDGVSALSADERAGVVRFNNTLYLIVEQTGYGTLFTKLTAGVWNTSTGISGSYYRSHEVYNDRLYIGLDNAAYYITLADDLNAFDPYVFFEKWNGYLYASTLTELSYSTDGDVFSGPYVVCRSPEAITGLCGVGDTIWITTTDALYYLAPGNVIRGVTRWGSSRPENGTSPVNFQGALYCIADGGVAQVNVAAGSVNVLPVWANRDDDLIADFLQSPIALTVMNNWLIAQVQDGGTNPRDSLWAYTGHGWHFLSSHASGAGRGLYYDFSTSSIWMVGQNQLAFNVRSPDYTINPLNDTASRYAPSAWLETPWINGGLVDTEKDFESVYIKGDHLAAGQTVTVFWQERGGAWQELGTVDADGEELRWSNPATRPATKEIKLGFRLFTNDMTKSPNIEAIRLKFRHNIEDRWAWTLILPIHDNQQMVDGDTNPYTRDQVKAHLESLVRSTPPFTFEDVDGEEYTVICAGYELNLNEYEHYDRANQNKYMAAVSLEQYIT